MKHNIVITAADYEDRIHFLVDCTCGETFIDIGCEMICIPLDLIENRKWEHLAKYAEKPESKVKFPLNLTPECTLDCINQDCIGHIDPENLM